MTGRSRSRPSSRAPLMRGLSWARARTTSAAMKRLAKSPKSGVADRLRGARGARRLRALGELQRRPRVRVEGELGQLLADRCDLGRDLGLVRQRERRLEVCELLLEHRPGALELLLLGAPLSRQERGRDSVGDRGGAARRVVGGGDVDHVRVLVDARLHLAAQRVDGLAVQPVLHRRPEQLPRREQDLHGREVALSRLGVRGHHRRGRRIEDELRRRLVRLGQQQRDHEHGDRDQDDDSRDQPAAALERVEIAADLDRIVRRKRRALCIVQRRRLPLFGPPWPLTIALDRRRGTSSRHPGCAGRGEQRRRRWPSYGSLLRQS